jgi:hypothetical protein
LITSQGLFIQKISLCIFASRITDHTRCSSYEQITLISSQHNVDRLHECYKITNRHAIRTRIYSKIEVHSSLISKAKQIFTGKLFDKSSGFKFGFEGKHRYL